MDKELDTLELLKEMKKLTFILRGIKISICIFITLIILFSITHIALIMQILVFLALIFVITGLFIMIKL